MTLITINSETFKQDTLPCVDLRNPNCNELFVYDTDWLNDRLKDGMVITKLDTPKESFIEYIPAEKSWKPISAPGYILINHVYVAEDDPDQWLKSELIQQCETDNSESNGMVIMLENEQFHQDQNFFLQRGYLEYAHLPGFTLLVKKFRPNAPSPVFILPLENINPSFSHSITIKYADQSAFINYYIHEMKNVFKELGFHVQLTKLNTASEARESGSPYGTFGVFMDGHFLTHKLLNRDGIEELIGTLDLNEMYPEVKYLYQRPLDNIYR